MKQEQTEEADARATEEAGAKISGWEEIQPLEERDVDLTDPAPDEENSVLPRGPRDKKEMRQAQKRDEMLKGLRDQADKDDSCYTIRGGLLYKRSTNHLGDDTLLLVLLRSCR